MKNKFLKIGLVLGIFAFIVSCNEDDALGDSTLTAKSPSLSVTLDFANTQTLIEEDKTYGFTVSISEPQIVNVVVKLSQTGGTATKGADFDFPSEVVIGKGTTSASGVITILSDALIEETEQAIITVATGKEANVQAINSETVTFNIENLVEGDLMVGLSWHASSLVTDNGGNEIDPTALADLRLLITDVPFTTILDGSDGGSFESYTLSSATPDGEYFVVADYYSAMNIPANLDLNVTFDQVGVINGQSFDFAAALNTAASCEAAHFILAKITKSGESYTLAPVGEHSTRDLSGFVGTWSGTGSWSEIFGYTTEIVTTLDADGELWMTGIAFQWFEGWWGEVIVTNSPVKLDVELCEDTFVIEDQFYIESTWNGSPQPTYNLSGSGTIGLVGGVPTIEILPIFNQGGNFDGTNFGGPPFKENITLP